MKEQTEQFKEYEKAKDFVCSQGFLYSEGKPISMGDGYEHIFIYEYTHKYDSKKICRMADLRGVQLKNSTKTISEFLDYFQVTIKEI